MIGDQRFSVFQANSPQARRKSFARLLLKKMLKARSAKARLRGKPADSQALRVIALNRGSSK